METPIGRRPSPSAGRRHRFTGSARLTVLLIAAGVAPPVPTVATADSEPGAAACERAARLALPNATLETRVVPAGAFAGPPAPFSGRDITEVYKSLPPFCRVSATARPTADSDIKIEVWLPMTAWNGRLLGLGNGGFAGLIDYLNLSRALRNGYAATATDAGHTGAPIDAAWALGHPEKVIDFGHRGIHEMTRVAKEAARAFYGRPPRRSYFAGCSDGGREALMEAQRYPEDYDGILAGAPAHDWTALLSTAVWHTQALTLDPASFIPPDRIPAIAAAVNQACDAADGVKDGVLNDPRRCRFDPASMQCKPGESSPACLTAPQVVALRKIHQGPRDAAGRQLFPGYPPGAETGEGGWALWITGEQPARSLMAMFGQGYFSHMVYEKPDWDYRGFRMERDLTAAVEKTAKVLDATDPDLRRFAARGGRLILYHGWQDPAIPAESTVNYYESIVGHMGPAARAVVRLYMAPGVQHCEGGPGPDAFGQAGDWSSDDPARSLRVALERWVEKGIAPSTIVATKYTGDGAARAATVTRPLCEYPQAARYKGTGNPDAAASFVCEAPTR